MAPLDDKESQQVLSTLIKQRKDSVEQFTKGGRQEMADKEAAEIKLIETYLPKSAGEEEIVAGVRAAIAEMSPPRHERHGHGDESRDVPLRRRRQAGGWKGGQRGGEEGVGGEVGRCAAMGIKNWFVKRPPDEVLGSKVLVCSLGAQFDELVQTDAEYTSASTHLQ